MSASLRRLSLHCGPASVVAQCLPPKVRVWLLCHYVFAAKTKSRLPQVCKNYYLCFILFVVGQNLFWEEKSEIIIFAISLVLECIFVVVEKRHALAWPRI